MDDNPIFGDSAEPLELRRRSRAILYCPLCGLDVARSGCRIEPLEAWGHRFGLRIHCRTPDPFDPADRVN